MEGVGKSINSGDNKQNENRGNILGKMGNTGGIIQGDGSAGHYFLPRDLIPTNFFK